MISAEGKTISYPGKRNFSGGKNGFSRCMMISATEKIIFATEK